MRVYAVRMVLIKFTGPWNVYRKRSDAYLWEEFELKALNQGRSSSDLLSEVVRAWLRDQRDAAKKAS
jgi:hypothetical protein